MRSKPRDDKRKHELTETEGGTDQSTETAVEGRIQSQVRPKRVPELNLHNETVTSLNSKPFIELYKKKPKKTVFPVLV